MASLGRLTIDMVANLAGFEKDMGRAQRVTAKSMQSVRRDLRRAERDADKARASLKRLGMQMGALTAVGVGVVAREFDRINRSANNLDKTAKVVGLNVEELQKLRFAAQQAAGVTSQTLDMAMQRFARRVGEAANNTGELLPIVEQMGIQLRDSSGNIRNQTDLLGEFADRIAETTNQQDQLRIAFKLFDSEGARLLPLLSGGSSALQDFMQQAEDTGGIISQLAVNDFVRLNDQFQVLQMRASALSVSVASDLVGSLADLAEFLNTEQGTRALKETLEDIGNVVQVVGTMIGVKMVAQLGAYTAQLAIATAQTYRHQIALANMSKTAATTAAASRGLSIAIRGMFGPLGLAATALGVFAISARDSSTVTDDLSKSIREMRFESRRFATQQQIIDDIEAFQQEAKDAKNQIDQLRSGLENLASDRQPGERLRDYNMRMGAVEEKTKLANDEIERLEQVANDASAKAKALGVELENFEDSTQQARQASEDLNDQLATDEQEKFLQWLQDLSDQAVGGSAPAVRQFARDIESLQEALDDGTISVEQYAKAAEDLATILNEELKPEEVKDGLDLGGIIAGAISIGDGANIGQSLGNALKASGAQGLQEGLQESMSEAFSNLDLDDATMQAAMVSIGEAIGGNIGAAAGTAIGAAIGAAVGGPAGAQIGAQIGNAIGTLLDPEKDPKFQIGGTGTGFSGGFFATGGQPKGQFETAFGTQFFRFRNVEDAVADQIKGALIDFDNTIAQIITDEDQLQRINDVLRDFGYDSQDAAASTEELLRQRFDAVLGTFDQFTQSMVREAYGLEAQAQRLFEIQEMQRRSVFTGNMGFGAQEDMLYTIIQMNRGTETLLDTFDRFMGTMEALQKITDLTGITFGNTLGAVVDFGDELLKVFGDDMQQFQGSLNRIFETFFDADEILEQTATASRRRASDLLAQIGVDLTDELLDADKFRELFENLLPTLSPEDAAILIEAGVSIADWLDATEKLNDSAGDASDSVDDLSGAIAEGLSLQRRYASLLGDTDKLRQLELDSVDESNRPLLRRIFALEDERAANQAAAQAAERAAQQQKEYADSVRQVANAFADAMIGVEETLALTPLNDFQTEMVGIHRQLLTTIDTINEAAGSAITQARAERALARAHEAAAVQAAAAVERLEQSTAILVREVFGTPLDEINRQINQLQNSSDNVADSIKRTNEAMADLVAFADSLLTGNLSPLPSRERLDLGLDQLISASEAGDVQAVQSLAQEVLRIGRERFATGPEFSALFNRVQDIIRSTVPAPSDVEGVEIVSSPELVALFKKRDRIIEEQSQLDRRASAENIAQSIADISQATGESFADVAERLGVPLDELASILGLDYNQLDAFLTGLQIETMTIAQDLQAFAKSIDQSINEMVRKLLAGLDTLIGKQNDDTSTKFPSFSIVRPVEPDPIPSAKMSSPSLPSFSRPSSFSAFDKRGTTTTKHSDQEVINNTAKIARSTEALLLEMRRDQLRSNRTALA